MQVIFFKMNYSAIEHITLRFYSFSMLCSNNMKLLKESNQHRHSVWSWLETFDLYQNSGDFPTRSVVTVLYLGHAVDIVIILSSVCAHDITLSQS